MILSSLCGALLAVITLDGVSGDRLTARASFDANNVRVGDPMTLTIDFIGNAEFRDLHPPALSREVDARVWKVDDASAKTDTADFSKRLVYRVRPLREGLWRFPALEFAYDAGRVATREIPVHVKAGVQAALAGLDETHEGLPMPDGLLLEVRSRDLSDDERFAWQRACRTPAAAAFAAFDFPEARLNEAACLTLDGNWARALKVYGALEWRTGQTPAIERGLVAALARKTADPAQELPAWRLAFRPVLRHAWPGRVGLVAGALALAAAAFWLCGRVIRLFAAVAFLLLLARPVAAQGMFDEIERMHQQMMQQMNSMMNLGGGGMTMTINGQSVEQMEPVEIRALVALSTNDVRVGETFRFLLTLESPRAVTLDQIRFTPSEMFGMVVMGKVEGLADGASANPSNRVRRLAVPVRYDVPFKGEMSFRVEGMVNRRQQTGRSSFSFSQNFAVDSPAVPVEIKPLPTDGQPADFSGIIGTGLRLTESADRTRVETNDVVRLTGTLEYASGYVPPGAVADVVERRPGRLVFTRYFVADGSASTPDRSLVYYDTATRRYARVSSRPVPLEYVAETTAEAESVAVDAGEEKGGRTLVLRFAPRDDAPVVERVRVAAGEEPPRETERRGDWVRLDTGRHAGWTRR